MHFVIVYDRHVMLTNLAHWLMLFVVTTQVIAREQIKQESELELNYGCLNNDLFLLDYGFVMSSNPYDHIELRYDSVLLEAASMAAGISSPNFSSPSPWQKEILAQLNLEGEYADLKVYSFHPNKLFTHVFYAVI